MKQSEFLFAGFGGQGVMFAGQLLAYAAMDADLQVTWYPSYGPEMRGGTAHCYVISSGASIGSPVVRNPGIAIIFNRPSFVRYEPTVAAGGVLVVNASLVEERSVRDDVRSLYVPASVVAEELGDLRIVNMVLLGAALTMHPVVSIDQLIAALEAHMPAHRRNLLMLNIEALKAGMSCARSQPHLI